MVWISRALRALILAMGLMALGSGAALACDNCERHDARDSWRHVGDWRDSRDGDREGWRGDGCRGDDCHRYAVDCRDRCEHRLYDGGCHDGCYRHHESCDDGCYRRADNYSCRSGRFDCRFERDGSDGRFRERYYDGRGWSGGGAYGYYGN